MHIFVILIIYYILILNIYVYCFSGLNFLDLMVRQGAIDNPPKTPFIMGFECAGIVEAVGEGVTELKVSINFWITNISKKCFLWMH